MAERVKDWFADARQEGRAEGKVEGKAEGKAEGQTEGAALVLQAMLRQKFGPLPDWAQAHIAHADTGTLQRWALNALQADRLEAVFER